MSEKINAREAGLIEAGRIYGKEAEEALRAHLSMIGQELYLWMSDLYSPRVCKCNNFDADGNRVCLLPKDENGNHICKGGGYFYSNSAKDNDGYEIDIESTVQAIRFCESSGMVSGDISKAFPKQMQLDVVAFAKSLQCAEDGYFYHPQWGKNIVPSRQGRDLGWATSIIKDFGDKPLYDTKNGHKGSLGAPVGVSAAAESDEPADKNSTWIAHFRTLDAFKAYLNGLDLRTRSYSSCNNINAQTGQLKARDAQAMADGECADQNGDGIAEDGFIAMLEEHFNSRQNPEHGLWEDEVHYNAVNGLMKISTSYNALGIKFNYADKAFASAIQVALIDVDDTDVKGKTTTGSVDVYNPWVAMSALLGNVKKFGTEEERQKLMDMLKENVVALIKATTKKAAKFKKEDGSFGYTWNYSPSKSQMAPVSVPETVEGDINGGSIATRGIFSSMCSALGLSIPFFTPDDFEIYINRIKKRCGYR